jgi:hypothetical protein
VNITSDRAADRVADRSPGPPPEARFVAVDWSGARDERAQRRHIWTATVEGATLTDLSAGRTREETVDRLLGFGADGTEVMVGLDFSFGFPEWFARAHDCDSGSDGWSLAARCADDWLRDCPPPFFGPRGTRRPPDAELFRATEHAVRRATGLHPKSIFQLAGPGTVGPGSLRGMPVLRRFRDAGWAVWPFDDPAARTVVELYPALAVGRSAGVASPLGRRVFLDARVPGITEAWPAAVSSRDAFDAAVAAFLMAGQASQVPPIHPAPTCPAPIRFGGRAAGDAPACVEGAIWLPPAP